MATPTSDEKTTAIITYITIIGLIIGVIMNSSKKSDFASYHIRNMLGLSLISIALSLLNWVGIPSLLINILYIALFVLWVLGFVGAIQGEKKEIPVVGKFFQDWFKSV
ncbi:MAG: putative membrane protein [Dokdonia sp.]|jgi:uncharacterized membrane protein